MVKIGFIVEGDNEKSILLSDKFRGFLAHINLNYVDEIFNAKGGGNLLPINIKDQVENLKNQGADHIVILTDQEDAPCITSVKSRIDPNEEHIVVIAVKAVEAWFLADTDALSLFIGKKFYCQNPESYPNPFKIIKEQKLKLSGRGVDRKRLLCSRMLQSGFSIQNAAAHPNCPSARYFLQKLKLLAEVE